MTRYYFEAMSVIFLFLSFEYTLIENAYLSLSSLKLKRLEEDTSADFELIKKLYNHPKLYSSIMFCDYFSNIIAAVCFAVFLYDFYGYIGIVISIVISPILIIVIGETWPKSMGIQKYDLVIIKKSSFLNISISIAKPFLFIIEKLSNIFIKITGGDKDYKEPLITEDELFDAVSLGYEEGILDKSESLIIENVMDFRGSIAKDTMTPRTDIVGISINSTYDEIVNIVQKESFSRMPVFGDDLDDIYGILHVKDLLKFDSSFVLKDNLDILKQPFYTFEYKPIGPLFNEMRAKRISVAIVTDEYGGTEGMLTIEDLIEKIVGSISDEFDEDEDEELIKIAPKEYLIDGSMNLEELDRLLDLTLKSDENDSIAGFLIEKLDRFPTKGEVISIDNLKFIIHECSKNRIEKLILKI
ncbi:putative hemolysin [Peptoniphilus asaccharolyticus DSM 20463]|uniref:Putative hemolysin n=1 Tax=Peptoniphilus asaccharolyticus DSM 20463 TaxID=573058 RepID=A0A1W1UP64_PEPAS|nr:hemolysin family protein [Peptoniphilus asaccharolyticus]MBL7574980.1 HlyC/CorC family transporter [Peptoniphilus asaccharolyticus]SMB82860.1 putative hemolysin [Peptoniphilus asaccharolyticus DSM 20463]